jgi:hypothetical protein
MLTIHILVNDKVDESMIEQCLESISGAFPQWWYKIVVGNLGANADVLRACLRYGAVIQSVTHTEGMDRCRNSLLIAGKTTWNLMIEPWEVLASGSDSIVDRVQNDGPAMKFTIVEGDSVSKQVRLWKDSRFINPVYERVEVKGEPSSCLILATKFDTLDRDLDLVNIWVKKHPTLPDPFYYRACINLSLGKITNFIKDAETYLFMEQSAEALTSITMIRYYLAMIYCYVKKDASKSLQKLGPCLLTRPLMAEFWCLLGDVFYHLMKKYDKAASFYENAMILGARRLVDDDWPMEISKYTEHPERMLDNCRQIINASNKVGSISTIHPIH